MAVQLILQGFVYPVGRDHCPLHVADAALGRQLHAIEFLLHDLALRVHDAVEHVFVDVACQRGGQIEESGKDECQRQRQNDNDALGQSFGEGSELIAHLLVAVSFFEATLTLSYNNPSSIDNINTSLQAI